MAIACVGMEWLNLLENEFDKAFVDLDLLLGEFDEDQIDLIYSARQKMTALSAAFAQLSHKSQVVFENSYKIEKEIAAVREELSEAHAARLALQKELQHLLLQLHSAQLQVSSQNGHGEDSDAIKQKLDSEMANYRSTIYKDTITESRVYLLRRENEILRHCNLTLQSESYGAKLAAKYLDKELAGRIQQIQLFGKDLKTTDYNRLWEQLEAEIHLHRHKTVIRACRAKKGPDNQIPYPPEHDSNTLRKNQGIGDIRTVYLKKQENEGLGISITGGRENSIPVIVSDIQPDLPAARSGALYVGDAIISVNGIDLRNCRHMEAAKILSEQPTGNMTLEVIFVAPDTDCFGEQDNGSLKFSYPFFDDIFTEQLSVCMSKILVDKGTDPINFENAVQSNDSSSEVSFELIQNPTEGKVELDESKNENKTSDVSKTS